MPPLADSSPVASNHRWPVQLRLGVPMPTYANLATRLSSKVSESRFESEGRYQFKGANSNILWDKLVRFQPKPPQLALFITRLVIIAPWCSGNTGVSETLIPGSNPGGVANK